MRQLIGLVRRFRRDERGVFGIIFALIAIVLVAMSGAVVDFTSVQQARTKAQVALDSAALALQPSIYTGTSASSIQSQAQALLTDRLKDPKWTWATCTATSDPCVTVNAPGIDTTAGTLTLTASMKVPMAFVSLVGVPSMTVQIQSVATRQKLNLEVAMVLDNSGSMTTSFGSGTRMTTLKSSATCAVNILFYSVTSCTASTTGLTANTNTAIGLVPFTEAVQAVAKGTTPVPAWIDQGSTSSATITNNNFDYTLATPGDTAANVGTGLSGGSVNRLALFNEMGVQWGGCVEARKSPYDTDATPPTSGDTLYTPYFAPAEPSTPSGYHNDYIPDSPNSCKAVLGNCTVTITAQADKPMTTVVVTDKVKSSKEVSGYPTTSTTTANQTTTSYQQKLIATNGTTTTSTGASGGVCTCTGETMTSDTTNSSSYNTTDPSTQTVTKSGSPTTTTTVTTTVSHKGTQTVETQQCVAHYQPTGLTDRQLQERLCKYNGATLNVTPDPSSVLGPNGDCPAAPLAALSPTPSTVIAAINAMQPIGGTNITEGAVWGFRELSPVAPFNAKPYDAATSKVLIVMTDGANTIYPGTNMNYDTYYSAYGYPWNQRLLTVPPNTTTDLKTDTTLEGEMNNRLTTVCTNAKTAGITVYTIGIDVKDSGNTAAESAANQTLLTNCATPTGSDGKIHYFFPNSATDLQNAFVNIAGQLAALRLAK